MPSLILRIGRFDGIAAALADFERAGRILLAGAIDDEALFGLFGKQEALMGAAARDDLSRCVADEYFVHDVLAIALGVAIDDDGASREPLANHHGREQVPFLARVEVAVNVGQIPSERVVNGAMENQSGSDGAAERRGAAIPWIVVAGAGDIRRDHVGRDVVGDGAEIAADVYLFAVENFFGHRGVSRAASFSAWS